MSDMEQPIYKRVRRQLNRYIRRSYLVEIAAGLLSGMVLFIVLMGIQVAINQWFTLSSLIRTLLFWITFSISMIPIIRSVIWRMIRWITEGRMKAYRRANRAIVERFPAVQDKLINILELEQEKRSSRYAELVEESIKQKSSEVVKYPFSKAVNLKEIMTWGITGVVLILGVVVTQLIVPENTAKGFRRTVQFGKEIQEIEKFTYIIDNHLLRTLSGTDFTLRVIPEFEPDRNGIEIEYNGLILPMNRTGIVWEHDFMALVKNVEFTLIYGSIKSRKYVIEVIPKVELQSMTVITHPPSYTGLKSVTRKETGTLEIPSGSKLTWEVKFKNASESMIQFDGETYRYDQGGFSYSRQVVESRRYELVGIGEMSYDSLFLSHEIETIPDLYPEIQIEETVDSIGQMVGYYDGYIHDDYGFSQLAWVVNNVNGQQIETGEITIHLKGKEESFRWFIDADKYQEDIMILFRVYDNDAINGMKMTESRPFYLRVKSIEEILQESKEQLNEIEENMVQGSNIIQELERKLEEFRRDQITSKMNQWEMEERIKEIKQLQNDLNKLIDDVKMQNSIRNMAEERMMEEEVMRKAEEIQQLLEEVMDDELKELLDQFQKMVEEQQKEITEEEIEQIDMNLENLDQQMEMSLELLKRFEVEKEVMRLANEMENMAESIDTTQPEWNEKEDIPESYEDWKDKVKRVKEENQSLKDPYDMENSENEVERLDQKMEESKNNNSQRKKSEIKQKMQDIAQKMKQEAGLANNAMTVDAEALRQHIHALNLMSLEHERNAGRMESVNTQHPVFSESMLRQKEIEQSFSQIKDSLENYGFRIPALARVIGEDLFHVETSFRSLWNSYSDGRANQVRMEQQRIMQYMNDIALKLEEVVRSIENAQGTGQGNKGFTDSRKPKEGQQSVQNASEQQNALKEQLKGMIDKMKQGKLQGKEGRKSMARMLAEREKMRRMVEQMAQSGVVGDKAKEKLNQAIEMMEEVEKDIIYNRVGDHTKSKDDWITTRLLEAENAEKERETENRRESKEFRGDLFETELDSIEMKNRLQLKIQGIQYRDIRLKEYFNEKYLNYQKQLKKVEK